eukprot:15093824-Alexandrium_andersonii.AAC.1
MCIRDRFDASAMPSPRAFNNHIAEPTHYPAQARAVPPPPHARSRSGLCGGRGCGGTRVSGAALARRFPGRWQAR